MAVSDEHKADSPNHTPATGGTEGGSSQGKNGSYRNRPPRRDRPRPPNIRDKTDMKVLTRPSIIPPALIDALDGSWTPAGVTR